MKISDHPNQTHTHTHGLVYHLHGVCEDDSIEPDEVLVVERVHGVDLTDEVIQSVWLVQDVRLQTLHCHIQLEKKKGGGVWGEVVIIVILFIKKKPDF